MLPLLISLNPAGVALFARTLRPWGHPRRGKVRCQFTKRSFATVAILAVALDPGPSPLPHRDHAVGMTPRSGVQYPHLRGDYAWSVLAPAASVRGRSSSSSRFRWSLTTERPFTAEGVRTDNHGVRGGPVSAPTSSMRLHGGQTKSIAGIRHRGQVCDRGNGREVSNSCRRNRCDDRDRNP